MVRSFKRKKVSLYLLKNEIYTSKLVSTQKDKKEFSLKLKQICTR